MTAAQDRTVPIALPPTATLPGVVDRDTAKQAAIDSAVTVPNSDRAEIHRLRGLLDEACRVIDATGTAGQVVAARYRQQINRPAVKQVCLATWPTAALPLADALDVIDRGHLEWTFKGVVPVLRVTSGTRTYPLLIDPPTARGEAA